MIRFDEKCWAVEETKCRTVYDTGEQSHDDQDHDHDGNDTMKLNVSGTEGHCPSLESFLHLYDMQIFQCGTRNASL